MKAPSAALFDLRGRIACVTGASSGIGQALATALARCGVSVIGVARRQDRLDHWVEASRAEGLTATAVAADLALPDVIPGLIPKLAGPYGAPDILINAAGVNPRQSADEIDEATWRASLDLNLSAPFLLAQALVPAMRDRGRGRIINIASLQSARAFPNGIAYGAAKGGIVQLTRAMAEAWSADGITCNALAPGFFPTELTAPVFDDPAALERLAAQTCIGRNGELDDLIGPTLFFASDASAYITGQTLFVDGGFTAK